MSCRYKLILFYFYFHHYHTCSHDFMAKQFAASFYYYYINHIVVDNLLQGSRYVVHRLFVSCYTYFTFFIPTIFLTRFLPTKHTTFIGEYMQFFPYSINFEDWVPILLGTISTYAYVYYVCFSLHTSHVHANPRNNKFALLPCCNNIYIRKVGLVQMVSSRK